MTNRSSRARKQESVLAAEAAVKAKEAARDAAQEALAMAEKALGEARSELRAAWIEAYSTLPKCRIIMKMAADQTYVDREMTTGGSHTQGPWILLQEECDKPYIRVRGVRPGRRYKIANVFAPVHEREWPDDVREVRANACLIAAAPQQHDALLAVRYAAGFDALDEATKSAVQDALDAVQKGEPHGNRNCDDDCTEQLRLGDAKVGNVFRRDGKYLRYSEHTTHTGTHRNVEWVADLQQATVFHTVPPIWLRKNELQDAEMLEATETRTVTMNGYKLAMK